MGVALTFALLLTAYPVSGDDDTSFFVAIVVALAVWEAVRFGLNRLALFR